jgi:mannitol/fructose-specific phosphotransferase system IIA component (Ntr-type)
MMICHYLTQNNILKLAAGASKESALKELVTELCRQNSLKNEKDLLQAILDREHESSTFLPTGIGIPHARTHAVSEITLIMGYIPEGFKAMPDADPTYLVFLFFSPVKEKEFGKHLKLLARIAAIFRDPAFVREVASAGDAGKIFSLIQHKERETAE